jgi:hypothetical protein
MEPELLVDGSAVRLELFLVLMLRGIEQLADDSVVQADHLVRDGRRPFDSQRDQSRLAPFALESHQVGRGHLATFARDLQKPVLMDPAFYAGRQIQSTPHPETVDVLQHMFRVRLQGCLTKPQSFHGRLRNECLNATWFRTLNDVRCTLAAWREEYNCERPHSSLDYRTPGGSKLALEGIRTTARIPSTTTTRNTTEKTPVMNG